jgi:hypothetical protein
MHVNNLAPSFGNLLASAPTVALMCLPFVPALVALALSPIAGIPLMAGAVLFTIAKYD